MPRMRWSYIDDCGSDSMLLFTQAKNLQSSLFEQANQISTIQRELDHNQQLLATTEEKLRTENVSQVSIN